MKKIIALLLALALLTGCNTMPTEAPETTAATTERTETTAAETTEEKTEAVTETVPETTEPLTSVVRLQNRGDRRYLPEAPVEMVPFEEIELEKVDTQEIYTGFDNLTALVESGASAEEILSGYYAMNDLCVRYRTMLTVASLRYEHDTTNIQNMTAYNTLSSASLFVSRKLETFFVACANSDQRQALEEAYFGEDFFKDYEKSSVELSEEFSDLTSSEGLHINQYQLALQDPRITYNGQLRSVAQLLADPANDKYDVYLQYYQVYNQKMGEIFVRLLEDRRAEAEMLGYDNYADYAFASVYGRDYTVEDARSYLKAVAEELAPALYALRMLGYDSYEGYEGSEEEVREILRQAAEAMGGRIAEAHEFMEAYHLLDMEETKGKITGSYTTYIPGYEAPYILIDPNSIGDRLMTLSHEFGHFTDEFVTYHTPEDMETAETFSQAFEFLLLTYAGDALPEKQREDLLKKELYETLDSIVEQASFAAFELEVYAMEEPTLEKVNEAFRKVRHSFLLDSFSNSGKYAQLDELLWIDIDHFFTNPCYVISYSVSADAAMQVYEKELQEPGAGLAAYRKLLERQEGRGFCEVVEQAGLEKPLSPERVHELSVSIREELIAPLIWS